MSTITKNNYYQRALKEFIQEVSDEGIEAVEEKISWMRDQNKGSYRVNCWDRYKEYIIKQSEK